VGYIILIDSIVSDQAKKCFLYIYTPGCHLFPGSGFFLSMQIQAERRAQGGSL